MLLYKIFEILVLLYVIGRCCFTIYKVGLKIDVYWIAYYFFILFFVFPELIFLINGTLCFDLYAGFKYIKNNIEVDFVYLCISFLISAFLRKKALVHTLKEECQSKYCFNHFNYLELSNLATCLFFIFTFLPTLAAILAPHPELYFVSFAAFYVKNVNISDRLWHNSVMHYSMYIGFIGVLALWLKYEKKINSIYGKIIRFYLFIVTTEILFFSSKRTLGFLIFFVMLISDIMYQKKTPWFKVLVTFIGGSAYFIIYQIFSGKSMAGGIEAGWVEHYALYFSRVIDFKLVIYSLLHPDSLEILEYPGQSFLFDIFAFVPRSLWPEKPLPFADYLSGAWKHVNPATVDSRNLTSWFAEAMANLSWFGLPFSLWFYNKFMKVVASFQNPIVHTYAIFICLYFMLTMVGSNHLLLLVLLLLYILLEKKIKFRKVL